MTLRDAAATYRTTTMNTITINGVRIHTSGRNITITNNEVFVDGVRAASGLQGIVEIKFEGDLASLRTEASVTCGAVSGDVDAGGSIRCGDVGGDVDAGGSVQCGDVRGSVDAGGSVKVVKPELPPSHSTGYPYR